MPSDSLTPFYYDNTYWVIQVYRRGQRGVSYLGPKRTVVPLEFARKFESQQKALNVLRRLNKSLGEFETKLITQRLGPILPIPVPETILNAISDIPGPYAFVALDWVQGDDLGKWFRHRSKSTYYRYRRKLLEYGIDITEPYKVVV